MKGKRWIPIVVVVAALALGGAWYWKSRSATAAPKYRTAAVERGPITVTVAATGTINPVVQVEVGSQVSGTLQSLGADYNSRVKRGQVIAQIEPSAFRARVVQADAAVAKAQAAVKEAQRVLVRGQELVKGSYISQAEVEGYEVALEQSQAELAQAKAQREVAGVDLANTTIRAPIDGVVIARSIELGQTVAASLQAPKLFVIANDLSKMQVETRIDEADIGRIEVGQPVSFTVDAFPDRTFEGRVAQVRLEPITEQNVVTYTTVIHTDNPELRLRPGMTANVSVRVAMKDDVLQVPAAALRFRPPMAPGRGREGGAFAATAGSGGRDSAAGGRAGMRGPGGGTGERGAMGATAGPGMGAGSRGGMGGDRSGAMRRGGFAGAPSDSGHGRRGMYARGEGMPGGGDDAFKPGAVYVLEDGKPSRVHVLTGLSDGTASEIRSDRLKAGDLVVVGIEQSAGRQQQMQPPPGMGGPQFRGPTRRGGGGSGGR